MPNFLRKSISMRFVIVLSFVILICFFVMGMLQSKSSEEFIRREMKDADIIKTELLAPQVLGGLRWKKADVIDALFTDLINNPEAELVSAYVFHSKDGKISHLQSSLHDKFDIEVFLNENQALNGERGIKEFPLGTVDIVYVPVIDTKKDEYLGGLMIAWSTKGISQALAEAKKQQIIVTISFTVLLVILMIVLLRRMMISPLRNSISIMSQLAEGEYNIDIPNLGRQDEIGVMARALDVFKKNAFEKAAAEKAKQEADLRAVQERKTSMNEMANRFETEVKGFVDQLLQSIQELGQTSRSLYDLSAQTQHKSVEALSYSGSAAQNVETVAAASEELNASIKEIIQQVTLSARLTDSASDQAKHTNEIVVSLQASTERIGEVVRLIQDIAEQTNLLALNATIEAARAGEAGKGFAVVANEVKTLAGETARATEEISERISEIRQISEESAQAIIKIADLIGQASQSVTSVTAAVEEQGAATGEISRSVQEAANGTQMVSRNIDAVSEAATRTGHIVQETGNALDALAQRAERLGEAVDTFIRTIRN